MCINVCKYLPIVLSLMVIKGLRFAGINVTGKVVTASFAKVTGAQDRNILAPVAVGEGAWQNNMGSTDIKHDIINSRFINEKK